MIFFVPPLVSGYLLLSLWRSADLFGWQESLFGAWLIVALVIQLFAGSTSVWLVGVLAQVALAIVLVLKDRINQIL